MSLGEGQLLFGEAVGRPVCIEVRHQVMLGQSSQLSVSSRKLLNFYDATLNDDIPAFKIPQLSVQKHEFRERLV